MRDLSILLRSFSLLLSLALSLCACGRENATYDEEESFMEGTLAECFKAETSDQEIRALWISQFDLSPICLEGGRQRTEADYTRRIGELLDNVQSVGINTLFVQVRPNGDSICQSEIFPSSPYAVGKIGKEKKYDPFGILLRDARTRGLSVHAWVNPLRCFTEANRLTLSGSYPLLDFCNEAQTGTGDPIVLWNGVWYLNPADERARTLIAEGVREILSLYPVDGIHLDDYFYPTTDPSFDSLSYSRYKETGGIASLADFRRESVSLLIEELNREIHALRPNARFGISPGGNTARNYNELFADVERWCREGFLDYLCPQVYFGLEHERVPFSQVCREFDDMTREGGVELLIGMTLGKAHDGFYGKEDRYAGVGSQEWIENKDILSRCLTIARELPQYGGVAFFSYQYFFSPEDGKRIEATAEECATLIPLLVAP